MAIPFKVGDNVMVFTTTMYYLGEIAAIDPDGQWLELNKASWVHYTGRLSLFFAVMDLGNFPVGVGGRKPRTEYMGDGAVIPTVNTVCIKRFFGLLPRVSLE